MTPSSTALPTGGKSVINLTYPRVHAHRQSQQQASPGQHILPPFHVSSSRGLGLEDIGEASLGWLKHDL